MFILLYISEGRSLSLEYGVRVITLSIYKFWRTRIPFFLIFFFFFKMLTVIICETIVHVMLLTIYVELLRHL